MKEGGEPFVYSCVIVFVISIAYIFILLYCPKSSIYLLHQDENAIERSIITGTDASSYINYPDKDSLRTVGYPYILKFFMLFKNWVILLLIFNCAVASWMFYVTYQLIGAKAWIMLALGSFVLYTPFFLTDLLFASIFVTAMWQINKRLWLHFLLLGVASLIRPSLQWFFIIEPAVLYFYGYRGKIVYLSFVIVFAATCFNSVRNFINHGIWVDSIVLHFNLTADRYIGGAESKIMYAIKAFISNILGSHYNFMGFMFNQYPNPPWRTISLVVLAINTGIWIRFGIRFLERKVNWGNILILIYFIGPTLLASNGGRMRLPIEWILLI